MFAYTEAEDKLLLPVYIYKVQYKHPECDSQPHSMRLRRDGVIAGRDHGGSERLHYLSSPSLCIDM